MIEIPFTGTGCRKNAGLTDKLRLMEVGQSIVLPISAWSAIVSCAHNAGIMVATRSLGSKTTVTCWRVE